MVSNVLWSRRELKERSKSVLHQYYWRIVFVTFILSILMGSNTLASGTVRPVLDKISVGNGQNIFQKNNSYSNLIDENVTIYNGEVLEEDSYVESAIGGTITIALVVVSLVIAFSGILIGIFFTNPLYVGISRFYIRSFDTKPRFRELFHAIENRYKNVTAIMFLRDLYTVLWTLLLVIPGIVKSYEYYMIPYLLAENPNLEAKEAFRISRQMMEGQKWKTFVLDLSFIGWQILSAITLGILGIFYVKPYVYLTGAALYRKLRGSDEIPQNVYFEGMEFDTVQNWYEKP